MSIFLKPPDISIIVPVWNGERYLHECMESLLSQTLVNIEIVCIDDSSEDGSRAILDSYADSDSRVKVLTCSVKSAAATRNVGLKAAQGKYIGFVDCDDWVDDDFFYTLFTAIENANADLARSEYYHHWPDGSVTKDSFCAILEQRQTENSSLRSWDHSVVVCNAIYRRDWLTDNKALYFDERLAAYEDVPWTLKACVEARLAVPVTGTYYHYRRHTGGLSDDTMDNLQEGFAANAIAYEFCRARDWNSEEEYTHHYVRIVWRYTNLFRRAFRIQNKNKSTIYDFQPFWSGLMDTIATCKYEDTRAALALKPWWPDIEASSGWLDYQQRIQSKKH